LSHKLKGLFLKALIASHGEREALSMYKLYSSEKSGLISSAENSAIEMQQLLDDVKKLSQHYPIQYLLGKSWFYELELAIGPGVLIPRPETEELVELILSENQQENARVLDVGTGSGCIPLVLKSKRKDWKITAVDNSGEALHWAKKNASSHKLRIEFEQLDILSYDPPTVPYDIIVSNPPYIDYSEQGLMSPSTVKYEPKEALYVEDPLIFYRRLVEKRKEWLKPEGKLYFEINEYKSADFKQWLAPMDLNYRIEKDMSGKERFLMVANLI